MEVYTCGLVVRGSRGASGRILLMWDRRVAEKVEECVGDLW